MPGTAQIWAQITCAQANLKFVDVVLTGSDSEVSSSLRTRRIAAWSSITIKHDSSVVMETASSRMAPCDICFVFFQFSNLPLKVVESLLSGGGNRQADFFRLVRFSIWFSCTGRGNSWWAQLYSLKFITCSNEKHTIATFLEFYVTLLHGTIVHPPHLTVFTH